jgi:hypothetical protein
VPPEWLVKFHTGYAVGEKDWGHAPAV